MGREGGRKGGREEGRNKGMKGGCWQKKGKVRSQHSEIIGFSILESTQCMVTYRLGLTEGSPSIIYSPFTALFNMALISIMTF